MSKRIKIMLIDDNKIDVSIFIIIFIFFYTPGRRSRGILI